MDSIVVDTLYGQITYDIPDNRLVAGESYEVDNTAKTEVAKKTTTVTETVIETIRKWTDSFKKATPAVVPPSVSGLL